MVRAMLSSSFRRSAPRPASGETAGTSNRSPRLSCRRRRPARSWPERCACRPRRVPPTGCGRGCRRSHGCRGHRPSVVSGGYSRGSPAVGDRCRRASGTGAGPGARRLRAPAARARRFDTTPEIEALLRGDWEAVFEVWAADDVAPSESDRRYLLEYSHTGRDRSRLGPAASARVTCASLQRSRVPSSRTGLAGDVEDNPALAPAEACEILGIEFVALRGEHDHAEGFNDSAAALPLVLPFLQGHRETRVIVRALSSAPMLGYFGEPAGSHSDAEHLVLHPIDSVARSLMRGSRCRPRVPCFDHSGGPEIAQPISEA